MMRVHVPDDRVVAVAGCAAAAIAEPIARSSVLAPVSVACSPA